MSYDVYLEIDTGCGETVDVFDRNYTSNCAPMWRAAGCDIAEFHGSPAPEFAWALTQAVSAMSVHPDKYRAMNPENGWGSYEGCLAFLRELLAACARHPKTTVRVWR